MLGPIAAVLIVVLQIGGTGTLVNYGPLHIVLLMAAGPVTALPLVLSGAAARRIPLTPLGTLMYLTPAPQFLWGVLVVAEAMPAVRWAGFTLVWLALAILAVDLVQVARAGRGRLTGRQPVRSTT